MMGKLLAVDLLKIKRKGFWFLVFLGPFGVVCLQMVNYGVRKDYLLQQSADDWGYYLQNVSSFTPLALVLGIAILTSFMVSIENETNAWKQLLALPITKMGVYLSKFTILAVLLLISSILLMLFTAAYGNFLQLGSEIPYAGLLKRQFLSVFFGAACVGLAAMAGNWGWLFVVYGWYDRFREKGCEIGC